MNKTSETSVEEEKINFVNHVNKPAQSLAICVNGGGTRGSSLAFNKNIGMVIWKEEVDYMKNSLY